MKGTMMRAVAVAGAVVLVVTTLVTAPRGLPSALAAEFRVVESRSVVFGPDLEVPLGAHVDRLARDFSREAYDATSGSGIVQWRPRSSGPVLLLASGGVVRAISVAFEERFQTTRGVGVGDPVSRLSQVYGRSLLSAGRGFTLGGDQGSTMFDTACTGHVNAIGLAMGPEGRALLGALWEPGSEDDCSSSS